MTPGGRERRLASMALDPLPSGASAASHAGSPPSTNAPSSTPSSSSAASSTAALRPPAHRVSPRAVRYWLARAAGLWVVILGLQTAWLVYSLTQPDPVAPWHLPLLAASAVVAAVHVGVMPRWRYRVHRWEVSEHAVYTQTGWFHVERRIAPLSRVQTVDTDQGAIARIFGLAKVTVTTASAAGPLVVEGLDVVVAADLVERLTAATEGERDDAT